MIHSVLMFGHEEAQTIEMSESLRSLTQRQADCEYIVIGSGARGVTVGARLAEARRKSLGDY